MMKVYLIEWSSNGKTGWRPDHAEHPEPTRRRAQKIVDTYLARCAVHYRVRPYIRVEPAPRKKKVRKK